ncbi:MAG: glycoside hydrolase [Prochlorothrix sp.]|nr:glycoside hydrolase [Prochlorothrix sp.]
MSHPLYVAFIWHQHQPLYTAPCTLKLDRQGEGPKPSPSAGGDRHGPDPSQAPNLRLPWVRLHGTKDYLDLVLLLQQFPDLHQTVNFVPSLILQLEAYAQGHALDPYLALSLQSVKTLTQAQKAFIIDHFFDANHRTLIAPHRRYQELYTQRQDQGNRWCLDHWTPADYGDLLAWHNLAWIDPIFWSDPDIEAWLEQGQGFTLADRQGIWAKQRDIISRIIPQHQFLQEQGQLELTTSPYTHPILPLLADNTSGLVAVPQMVLPPEAFRWPEDLERQLRKGWTIYQDYFQRNPLGLWPSEQAVSPAILNNVAHQGFRWLCSDEAVLGQTLQHYFHRDSQGFVRQPEFLYRPYRISTAAGDLSMVFRDRHLSDLIGFTYSAMTANQAASDLVEHLQGIAHNLKSNQPTGGSSLESPWLVTIALDGENCWEFYHQDGRPFLETLYQTLSHEPRIQLVTVSEFLERFPPTASLSAAHLHSGSWVDASFSTWIGDPIKNKAWELLTTARQVLAQHPEATEVTNPAAWEALDAAEGSDWFWWFGEGHSSNQDAIFDQLFREHLATLYQALGEPVPEVLQFPLDRYDKSTDHQPQNFIHPIIDGRRDDNNWDAAGRLELGGSWGTMHRASAIQRLWYGVDQNYLYLRLDVLAGVKPGIDCPPELHLFCFYPDRTGHNSPIPLANLPNQAPLNYLYRHHLKIHLLYQSVRFLEAVEYSLWQPRISYAKVAVDECIELAVPWRDLEVGADWSLSLVLVLARNGQFQNYLPEDQLLTLRVPPGNI